eukprot:3640498-Rhodomonas_salina.8
MLVQLFGAAYEEILDGPDIYAWVRTRLPACAVAVRSGTDIVPQQIGKSTSDEIQIQPSG